MLLLPFVLAVAWSANRTRSERQAEIRDQVSSIAVSASAQFEQHLAGLDAMASAIVRHPTLMSPDHATVDAFLIDLLRSQPLVDALVLTSPDGRVLGSSVAIAPEDVTWRYIAEVVRMREPVVTDVRTSVISGRPIIMLGYPVFDSSGNVSSVLGLGIDLLKAQFVLASIPMPEGSVISVADREGNMIARSVEADKYIGKSSGTPKVTPGTPPVISLRAGPDGVERFYGDVAVRQGAWTLSVGIPRTEVVGRLRPMYIRNLVVVASAFTVLITLGLVIAWQTTLHLNRLRHASQRIADGDLSPLHRVPTPSLEFAQLQDAFITMAGNLREARNELNGRMEQERKMNEALQSLQRQVVRQERLAAVGLLVSGVAHELNNPLQAILGTAELLERQPGITKEAVDEILFVKTQAGRAREIIRNLSRFSNQQSGPQDLVDLRDVIKEVVQLRQRDLDLASIGLDVQTTTARKVSANFTEIEQVTLNFVINAQQSIEATGTRGRILIRLFDIGRKVRLEVLDNGSGVKPEDEAKLFQPFFTTKPVGKGTGLGLSVSYGIIDSYGGTIGQAGNEWGGATFFFELPAAERASKPDDQSAVLHGSV